MKISKQTKTYIEIVIDDKTLHFTDEAAVKQYLDNRLKSIQNVIAHYKSELVKHEIELAQCLHHLEVLGKFRA